MAELRSQVAELRSQVAELRGQLDAVQRVAAHHLDVAELRAQLEAVRRSPPQTPDPARFSPPSPDAGAAASRTEPAPRPAAPEALLSLGRTGPQRETQAKPPGPSATPASLPPQARFDRAMASFRGGDLGQAVVEFEDLVHRHPSHPLAGRAQFWIGEAYFKTRDYRHATVEYQKAVSLTNRGDKTPEALLKMGLAHRALGRSDRAREAWARLLREFPQSAAAEKARAALREASTAGKVSPASLR